MITIFLLWVNTFFFVNSGGRTYYVSPSGNDSNNGLSSKTPWQSLQKVNSVQLGPGDCVVLEGGQTFMGPLLIEEDDAGNPKNPIQVTSYGKGKAIINAGKGAGILVHNTQGVRLKGLIVKGDGVGRNKQCGIELLADKPTLFSSVEIADCEAYGFHRYGILINANKNENAGFEHVKVIRCIASQNGNAGIGSLAYYPAISHRDLYVANCKVFDNKGDTTNTQSHTGNGIVLSGAEKVLIEHCEAYENGEYSRSLGGGPVGIWVWNCRKGIIQHCISHHNHAGLYHDGGGFDIDGGASQCIIQNCVSYDNEGAGYLICEFGAPNKCTDNKILNNISRNDGLKNSYGGISVSGASAQYQVENCLIKGNKIYVLGKNKVNGIPVAVYFNGLYFRDIRLEDNYFEVTESANVLRCDSLLTPSFAQFAKNKIKSVKPFSIVCKKCTPSQLEAMRKRIEGK